MNGGGGGGGMARAGTVLLVTLSVEVAVLVVTGVALFFVYRPPVSAAWDDLPGLKLGSELGLAGAVRFVHQLASWLAVVTAVGGVVVASSPRCASGCSWWRGGAGGRRPQGFLAPPSDEGGVGGSSAARSCPIQCVAMARPFGRSSPGSQRHAATIASISIQHSRTSD